MNVEKSGRTSRISTLAVGSNRFRRQIVHPVRQEQS